VDDLSDVLGEHGLEQTADAGLDGDGRIVWAGEDLDSSRHLSGDEKHEIGERASDVHSDPSVPGTASTHHDHRLLMRDQ
jgi:hypothetical protein